MFEIDELKIYRGSDIPITDKIIVTQPTIDQIIEFGEKRYFQTVYTLTGVGADFTDAPMRHPSSVFTNLHST